MTKLKQDRSALFDELQSLCSQGQAENEPEDESAFLRHFLPVRTHYRILEPQVQLIIGDKGAGKTQLFRALSYEGGREGLADLAGQQGSLTSDPRKASWYIGFASSGTDFPPGGTIRSFAQSRSSVDLQTFWLGLLVRVLCKAGQIVLSESEDALRPLITSQSPRIDLWFPVAKENQGDWFAKIDELDAKLTTEDRHVFITYDDLDRVSPGDWQALGPILQGLVQFWAAYGRRYKRLRPKLFLRRDLYERVALFGPDIAKIAAHRVELLWTVADFYGVLFKRILNSQGELVRWLGQAAPVADETTFLGRLPKTDTEIRFKPAAERLFGEYMGLDARKGFAFRWIPNHLKDGHRRIFPRPLLRLIEEAVGFERRDSKAKDTGQLIHHTALRGALDKVSEFRVLELAQEEFPWLKKIQSALFDTPFVVPAERRVVLKSLNIDWGQGENTPPSTDPGDILEYMVKLGIFQFRLDGRIDAGDLYLRGLHLKRKGGVAQPQYQGRNT